MARPSIVVGVIGPPAVGKSTLTRSLARCAQARVITPRTAIRATLAAHPGLHPLFAPINELGWVSDGALGLAVRLALARPDHADLLVLENLPGDAVQVADLWHSTRHWRAQFVMLHLTADPHQLLARGLARRVCVTCESSPDAEPHDPAGVAHRTCRACGNELTPRRDDAPDVLSHRTARHEGYARRVLQAAGDLGMRIVPLDANRPASSVLSDALACIMQMHRHEIE